MTFPGSLCFYTVARQRPLPGLQSDCPRILAISPHEEERRFLPKSLVIFVHEGLELSFLEMLVVFLYDLTFIFIKESA